MKDYFSKAFQAVLDQIQDKTLREKVVNCWAMAAEEGGWKEEQIPEIPFTLLTDTMGINLIEHTIAVTLGAVGLAQAMMESYREMPITVNMDYLYAGGLLHDVGKLLEFEYVDGEFRKSYYGKCARHPISGAIVAAKAGLPNDIINMIANHAKEGEGRPQRIETVLIHQADFATFNPLVMRQKGLLIE